MSDYEKIKKELNRLQDLFPNTVIVTGTQRNRTGNNTLIPLSRNRCRLGPDIIYIDYINLLKPTITEDDGN